jgi:hypothetical protein
MRRDPRMLCHRGGGCKAAYERSRSGNHSIRWSVMLQRHRDEGFYMAMAFVRWCLPPLISIDVGSRLRFR